MSAANSDNTARSLEAVDRVIEILVSARRRKKMYFYPIEPKAVEYWTYGLRTGVSIFGLDCFPEFRREALKTRGLQLAAKWETDELAKRGLSEIEIVDELLSLEIEMWQSYRESLAPTR